MGKRRQPQKKFRQDLVLGGLPPAAELPIFGTGQAADIVGIPVWRLQKFLDSKAYQFPTKIHLGSGRGSRRTFMIPDIYRIAIAARLVEDGFAASFIGQMFKELEKMGSDFRYRRNDEREEYTLNAIGFRRTPDGPRLQTFYSKKKEVVPFGKDKDLYYVLDFAELWDRIGLRLKKFTD